MGTETAMGLLTGLSLWSLAVAVSIFLLLVDLMHQRVRWAARYPPGPMPLPWLGNMLQLDFQDLHRCVNRVRKRGVGSRGPGGLTSQQAGQELSWEEEAGLRGLLGRTSVQGLKDS